MSAIRVNLIVGSLPYKCLDQPEVKYFMKSVRINRPIKFRNRNFINIPILCQMVNACDKLYLGFIFKTVFLMTFSNIAPHSLATLDRSRHLLVGDTIFTKSI